MWNIELRYQTLKIFISMDFIINILHVMFIFKSVIGLHNSWLVHKRVHLIFGTSCEEGQNERAQRVS